MNTMNNKIEKIVAKLEGKKKGNAFLIDGNHAVTVRHCVDDPTEKVKLIFPKLYEDKVIEIGATIKIQDNTIEAEWLLLELDYELPTIKVTLASMIMQPLENSAVYGYDANFRLEGKWTQLQSSGSASADPNLVQDLLFDPKETREEDFSGLSGSPIVKGDCIIGIVSQEVLENQKAICIYGVSIYSSKEFFEKNEINYENRTDIGQYSFDLSMGLKDQKSKNTNITVAGEQGILNKLQGVYRDKLLDIVKMHRRGDVDSAWNELKKQIVELEKDSFISAEIKAEYYYRTAIWFMEDREELSKAQKRYEKAKALNPLLRDSIFQALFALKSGENQNAEELLEPVNSVDNFNVYLQICINEHKYEKAYEKYEEIDQTIDFNGSTYYLLSILAVLRCEYDDAKEYIDKAIEEDKKVPLYYLIKGIVSFWKALPKDISMTDELYPAMYVNGLLHLTYFDQQLICEAVEDYRQAYHLAEDVGNKEQMEFILGVWINSLSVDSFFQNDVIEPLQQLRKIDPFNVTALLYMLHRGMELDENITIENLEKRIKNSNHKMGYVIALIELCLKRENEKEAKRLLHEYRLVFFNEALQIYWYEYIIKVEKDPMKIERYEKEIRENTDLEEIQRKRLLAVFVQRDVERDPELEALLKDIYEKTGDRIDVLNLISYYKMRRKWRMMQYYSEILVDRYGDAYGSIYKIQSLFEQQEYETVLDSIEDLNDKGIEGLKLELLRYKMKSYERMGRYSDAIAVGKEVLKDKASEQNISNLANLYALDGDETAALNTLLKAEEYNILTVAICKRISYFYLTIDNKKSLEYARRAMKISEDQPDIMLWASNIAYQIGRSDVGEELVHRVMTEYPDQQLLMTKSLDEVMDMLERSRKDTEKRLQMLRSAEIPSHLFVDTNGGNQTYAEYFYGQWNRGRITLMEFGAHYTQNEQLRLNIKKCAMDYSSILFLQELGLLEVVFENMDQIYVSGDLFGVLSEEIRKIPEGQPDFIRSEHRLVQKCKEEYHIDFVEVCNLTDLEGIDVANNSNLIGINTAKEHDATWISSDYMDEGIHGDEVITALYRNRKITRETYEEYGIATSNLREEKIVELLRDSRKLLVEETLLSKWDKYRLLSLVTENYIVLAEKSMENEAEIAMERLIYKQNLCEKIKHLRDVIDNYKELGKIRFVAIEEKREEQTYTSMLTTVMSGAQKMKIPLVGDDRMLTSYSNVGEAPIYNTFDLMKNFLLLGIIHLEEYCDMWKKSLTKNVSYVVPDNFVVLHAIRLSGVDKEKQILKESELLRVIRKYVSRSMSSASELSNEQLNHVHIPERDFFVFHIQCRSRELLKLIWQDSDTDLVKRQAASNWILRHYSQFAFDFKESNSEKRQNISHAIQVSDFLLSGILMTKEENQKRQYYNWLYGWIQRYLEVNVEIKEKALNYTQEFICSYLRKCVGSMNKKEYLIVKNIFATGIYYMPGEYRTYLLRDEVICQMYNSIYSKTSIVLTRNRQVPIDIYKDWEHKVLLQDEKELLNTVYDGTEFCFSWEYLLPDLVGITVRWREEDQEVAKQFLLDSGESLKNDDKEVRTKAFQYISRYLPDADWGKAKVDILNLHKYEQAAKDILQLLYISEKYVTERIKVGMTTNWGDEVNVWKFMLPPTGDYFRRLFAYDGDNKIISIALAEMAMPIRFGEVAVSEIGNHNPVRLLHRLGWLLQNGANDDDVKAMINTIFSYAEGEKEKYGKTYILLLKSTWRLFQKLEIYHKEKYEDQLMWAYIWADKMMSVLSQLVLEEKIDLDCFVEKIQREMDIDWRIDGLCDNKEGADILLPSYMNLYRLCVTGTLSICCKNADKISHVIRDILELLTSHYISWVTVPVHFCETELLHQKGTNVFESILSENVYKLIESLTQIGSCEDIIGGWKKIGGAGEIRRYSLTEICKAEAFGINEILYMFIISREITTEEDVINLQEIIKKQVLAREIVIEEKRYNLLAHIVSKLSEEFQAMFKQHEFARIGELLQAGQIQADIVDDIVTDIAEVFGIEDYLTFWEENAKYLDEDVALDFVEKIGWLQYSIPYEYTDKVRELRVQLELMS